MTTDPSDDLVARARDAIRRHGMLHGGETVLIAVSGGADSVALLHVLSALGPELDLRLRVVHVDHGLRPDAPADAEFVRGLCARLCVPFHLERVSVARAAGSPAAEWQGLEAEARRARHEALRERARREGARHIATGHTADDQAETVLMRLLAGAGPRGLAGIAPARGVYIRPLIECRRAEIEAHLQAAGLGWVEDGSNRDARFLRNQVRHDVLPYLRDAYDTDIAASLCRGAAVARALVVDLERRARAQLSKHGQYRDGGLVLSATELARLPEDVAVETLRAAAVELGATSPLRGPAQRALHRVLSNQPVHGAIKVGRVQVERSGRWIRVGMAAPLPVAPRRWQLPGELALSEVGLVLDARCLPASAAYELPRNGATVAFDADRIPSSVVVRARRTGDRFAPFGGPGPRRLKSFLIDAGIPRWQRESIPLLVADGEIVWVVGLRRGLAAPVTPRTKRILEVTVRSPLAVPMPTE